MQGPSSRQYTCSMQDLCAAGEQFEFSPQLHQSDFINSSSEKKGGPGGGVGGDQIPIQAAQPGSGRAGPGAPAPRMHQSGEVHNTSAFQAWQGVIWPSPGPCGVF